MIGIYKITSPNGKIYIGQSVNIERRFIKYKHISSYKNQIKLKKSFLKYGVDNHTFEIVEECELCLLNDRERYWQDFYNVLKFGLNCKLTKSSDKSGKLSDEIKSKIGASNKIANKGKKVNKNHIENLRIINKGKRKPKGFSQNLSNNRKGIKNPMYGKKISESSRKLQIEKISAEFNYLSKIILNTQTGIFYHGLTEASKSANISKSYLHINITKNKKNKTNFIYV
jgi:group I intron endonuclease